MTIISTIEQLETIYGFPNDASTVKVADRVTAALWRLCNAMACS